MDIYIICDCVVGVASHQRTSICFRRLIHLSVVDRMVVVGETVVVGRCPPAKSTVLLANLRHGTVYAVPCP